MLYLKCILNIIKDRIRLKTRILMHTLTREIHHFENISIKRLVGWLIEETRPPIHGWIVSEKVACG